MFNLLGELPVTEREKSPILRKGATTPVLDALGNNPPRQGICLKELCGKLANRVASTRIITNGVGAARRSPAGPGSGCARGGTSKRLLMGG